MSFTDIPIPEICHCVSPHGFCKKFSHKSWNIGNTKLVCSRGLVQTQAQTASILRFSHFSQSLQENSGRLLQNHSQFLHHLFQFIIQQSLYHLTIHSPKLTVSSNNSLRQKERDKERDSKNIIINCLHKLSK